VDPETADSQWLPTFIIGGAMRAGTSSLNAYLREHPEISVSRPKEVHFFDQNYGQGLEWYRQHFPHRSGIAIGEATPDYLYHQKAPQRIAETLPQVRVLLMLRDPVDRAYSHYWHNRSVGKEQLPFEEALRVERHRLEGSLKDRVTFSYVDRGRYSAQIERLFGHIDPGRVLIQTFDDLQSNPELLYRRTCKFLGVDQSYLPKILGSHVNAYAGYRSVRVRSFSKSLPKTLRNAVAKFNKVPKSSYPPISKDDKAFIEQELIEDTARLLDLIRIRAPWIPE
jgi:hypothetical protein